MSILLLVLCGGIIAWRRGVREHPMRMIFMLFFLGTALCHMLLETQVRYHYNAIPFLLLLAAWTMVDWRTSMQLQPAERLIRVPVQPEEKQEDHTHFDMAKALREGHVRLSVSQAVANRAEAESEVKPAEEGQIREEAPPQDELPSDIAPPTV